MVLIFGEIKGLTSFNLPELDSTTLTKQAEVRDLCSRRQIVKWVKITVALMGGGKMSGMG